MIDEELTLLAYDVNGTFVGEFTPLASKYRQEWTEGPELISFELEEGTKEIDDKLLRDWFERRIMWRVIARADGVVAWDGFIHDMSLHRQNTEWRKSIEKMANAITATYTDSNGDTKYITDKKGRIEWFTDDESITLYGRRERVLKVNTESEDEAEERASSELRYSKSPYSIPPIFRETRNNRLIVQAVGRHFLANGFKLLPENLRLTEAHQKFNDDEGVEFYAYREDTNVSSEVLRILELIEEYSGWLYPLSVSDRNDTYTKMGVPTLTGAWDRLLELAKLRDRRGDTFFRLSIAPDGGVIYAPFDETPEYYFKPDPNRIVYADETRPKYRAKPGIVRVLDASVGPSLPDTWLSDKRNIFAERTTIRDGDEYASFHTREYNYSDKIRAIEAHKRWLERK